MSTPCSSFQPARPLRSRGRNASVLILALLAPGLAAAPKGLDRAAERWLREVHLLILPEEEALFRSLPGPEDRKAFQQIFWARRDPDPATAKNEMEEALVTGRARANELFTSPSEPGVETGCGQVYLLLGDPAEVQGVGQRELQGRGARQRFDSLQPMRDGARRPRDLGLQEQARRSGRVHRRRAAHPARRRVPVLGRGPDPRGPPYGGAVARGAAGPRLREARRRAPRAPRRALEDARGCRDGGHHHRLPGCPGAQDPAPHPDRGRVRGRPRPRRPRGSPGPSGRRASQPSPSRPKRSRPQASSPPRASVPSPPPPLPMAASWHPTGSP